MREGWVEIDPREKLSRDKRRPYIVMRPKEGKIYFSFSLVKAYLQDSQRIVVRYNDGMGKLSFVNSENGRGYKLSEKRCIGVKNLFNRMSSPMKRRKAFFVRYNNEAKWLEVNLTKSNEGDMKWLKA